MKLEKLEHEEYERLKKENEELRKCVEILNRHFKWTRIDLNDPKTFPPKTNEYIVAIEGHSTSITRKYSAEHLEFFAPEKITHWRPLPKLPVESEVCK